MVWPLKGGRASGHGPGPAGILLVIGMLLLLPITESHHLFGSVFILCSKVYQGPAVNQVFKLSDIEV